MATAFLWISLILNFLAALITGSHAAMYKRDPRAAVCWILACFTIPFLGSIFYWIFGVNRIRRRQIDELSAAGPPSEPAQREASEVEARLEEIGHPEFTDQVHLARRITGHPLLPGNRVEPLIDGEEAYPAMLSAIRSARRTVNLSTYIFDGDATGRLFARALAEAAGRGVEVRVLVDGLGERYSWVRARKLLKNTGVKSAKFVPPIPLWRGAYFNLRNHRKILVIDGEVGFTGGMNIGDRHLAAQLENPRRTRDMHFRLQGPVVAELQRVFIEDWWFVTEERLEGEKFFPPIASRGSALCRGVTEGPNQDHEQLRYIIIGAIACARRRVQIMTPYFIPDRVILASLVTSALQGVEVDLLLPQKSNLPFFQWATTAYLWELLQFGVRVYLQPPPFVHTKLIVIDDVWTLIGSANLDPRSLRLNFEFNVEIYDPQLASRLGSDMNSAAEHSRLVTLEEVDSRSVPVRLRDGLVKLFSPYL